MLLVILLFALIVLTAWLFAYTGKVQTTTLWAGRRIGEPEFESQNPTGFQDAITPKFQNTMNIFVFLLYFIILVIGVTIKWYVGIAGVVITVFISFIIGTFLSNDLERYLLRLINNMDQREADYRKDNDTMRAEAAHYMLERLSLLLKEIHGKEMPVPSMKEARRVPMGLRDYE